MQISLPIAGLSGFYAALEALPSLIAGLLYEFFRAVDYSALLAQALAAALTALAATLRRPLVWAVGGESSWSILTERGEAHATRGSKPEL